MFNVRVRVSLWLGTQLGPRGLTTAHYAFRGKGDLKLPRSRLQECVGTYRFVYHSVLSPKLCCSKRDKGRKKLYILSLACVYCEDSCAFFNFKRINHKNSYHYLLLLLLLLLSFIHIYCYYIFIYVYCLYLKSINFVLRYIFCQKIIFLLVSYSR